MRGPAITFATVLAFAGILSLIAVMQGEAAVVLGIVAPAALAVGAALLAQPFLGVFAIAFFSQIDALLSVVLQGLPGIKLLTAATLGAALLNLGFRGPRSRFSLDPAVGSALVFALLVVVSAIYASGLGPALTGIRRFASLFLLFVLMVWLVDTERKLGMMLAATIGACVISALLMIFDSQVGSQTLAAQAAKEALGDARPTDATTAASVLLAGASSALVVFLRGTGWVRAWGGAAMLIIMMGILATLTRSAMLGFGLALAWQAWIRRDNPFVVTAAILSGVAFLMMLPEALLDRLTLLVGGGHDFTLDRRLGYHLIGFDLLAKNPIVGIGPDNFADYYVKFEYRWYPGRTLTPRVLHNMYLAVAVELGLPALIAFVSTLFFALHGCWKALHATQSPRMALYAEAILFGAIMLLLVSATLPNETNKYVWIYAGLAAAAARIEVRRRAAALQSDLN